MPFLNIFFFNFFPFLFYSSSSYRRKQKYIKFSKLANAVWKFRLFFPTNFTLYSFQMLWFNFQPTLETILVNDSYFSVRHLDLNVSLAFALKLDDYFSVTSSLLVLVWQMELLIRSIVFLLSCVKMVEIEASSEKQRPTCLPVLIVYDIGRLQNRQWILSYRSDTSLFMCKIRFPAISMGYPCFILDIVALSAPGIRCCPLIFRNWHIDSFPVSNVFFGRTLSNVSVTTILVMF